MYHKFKNDIEQKVWILKKDMIYKDKMLSANTRLKIVLINKKTVFKVYVYKTKGDLVARRLYLLFAIYEDEVASDKIQDDEFLATIKKKILEFLREE